MNSHRMLRSLSSKVGQDVLAEARLTGDGSPYPGHWPAHRADGGHNVLRSEAREAPALPFEPKRFP